MVVAIFRLPGTCNILISLKRRALYKDIGRYSNFKAKIYLMFSLLNNSL